MRQRRLAGATVVALVGALIAALTGACAAPATPAAQRAVAISTTACGHASKTVGSGVLIATDRVLTAAHVVIGAATVSVDGDPATIVRLDPTTDLALLQLDQQRQTGVEPILTSDASAGDQVTVVGGLASGTVAASIGRKLDLAVNDVRSPDRSLRHGYELEAQLAAGDSGAGVFNESEELVAVIFSGPVDSDGRSFAVDHREIDGLLRSSDTVWTCSPDANRVEQDL